MNVLDDATWDKLLPRLREVCPRLTEADFADAGRRVDLLTAKIQNRHWVNKIEAGKILGGLLREVN